ncbi:Alpha/Beta hydrolase protein [Mycena capillaripes]|nr:Alpha/Beta hydrolase protein [Mycena capillaripes]
MVSLYRRRHYCPRPMLSVSRGSYAKVPIMTGDVDDEGTIFSFTNMNITTDAEVLRYVHSNYLLATTPEQIAQIGELYPDDPTQGSPFDTGTDNALTPEFKRLAAFQPGDLVFTGPRRFFLEHASKAQNAWSWLNKRGKDTPIGAFHASDTLMWFPDNTINEPVGVDALINFINTPDPNLPAKHSTPKPSTLWPSWNTPSPSGSSSLLTFTDVGINITAEKAIGFVNNLRLEEVIALGE